MKRTVITPLCLLSLLLSFLGCASLDQPETSQFNGLNNTLSTLANITGPGVIHHIWMTPTGNWRFSILRMYWDGEEAPSVEVPVGDFFANGWCEFTHVNSGHQTQCGQADTAPLWPLPLAHHGSYLL